MRRLNEKAAIEKLQLFLLDEVADFVLVMLTSENARISESCLLTIKTFKYCKIFVITSRNEQDARDVELRMMIMEMFKVCDPELNQQ